jgi:uncharacterized protein (UPF0335 family)
MGEDVKDLIVRLDRPPTVDVAEALKALLVRIERLEVEVLPREAEIP